MANQLPPPPGIARGGFSGGVAVNPAQPTANNSLLELASSLSDFSNAVSRGGSEWFQAKQRNRSTSAGAAVLDNKKQREEGAQAAELLLQNELAGYTSKQIGEAITSDPLAAKFKANPYILPALQIHRGRVAADEAINTMTSAGVDIRNAEAVNSWLAQNAPEGSDPFLAQGWNEQMDRNRAMLTQMQFKQALEEADSERLAMAGREVATVLSDASLMDRPIAERVSAAFAALEQVPGLSGPERTEVQVQQIKLAADKGDLELAEALADAKRGDAPSLRVDANTATQVSTYLDQALTNWRQANAAKNQDLLFGLRQKIEAGISLPGLKSDPALEELREGDPDKYGMALNYWLAQQEDNKRRAEAAASASQRGILRQNHAIEAAQMLLQGKGEFISDLDIALPDGTSYTSSGETARREGLTIARNLAFPQGILAIPPERMENLRVYTRKLADSATKDDQLAGYLEGLTAYMTPEALKDIEANAADLAYGYQVYKHIDPTLVRQYLPDDRSRAVFARMDEMLRRDPTLDPAKAAQRAVAVTSEAIPKLSQPALKEAFNGVTLTDPLKNDEKLLWVFGGNPKQVTPERDTSWMFMNDRYQEYRASGLGHQAAVDEAKKDFQAEHTVVNGSVLQLPQSSKLSDPTKASIPPAKFAAIAESGLKAWAASDDLKGYAITNGPNGGYIATGPNGKIAFLSYRSLTDLAAAWDGKTSREDQAKRKAAADAAAASRNPKKPGPDYRAVK